MIYLILSIFSIYYYIDKLYFNDVPKMKYINIIFVKKSIVAVDGGKRQGGGAVAGGKSCGIVLVV